MVNVAAPGSGFAFGLTPRSNEMTVSPIVTVAFFEHATPEGPQGTLRDCILKEPFRPSQKSEVMMYSHAPE